MRKGRRPRRPQCNIKPLSFRPCVQKRNVYSSLLLNRWLHLRDVRTLMPISRTRIALFYSNTHLLRIAHPIKCDATKDEVRGCSSSAESQRATRHASRHDSTNRPHSPTPEDRPTTRDVCPARLSGASQRDNSQALFHPETHNDQSPKGRLALGTTAE